MQLLYVCFEFTDFFNDFKVALKFYVENWYILDGFYTVDFFNF